MVATMDFSDIEEKYSIQMPTTFDNLVIVDNVPIVDTAKEEKLLNVIKKIFKPVALLQENAIVMPKDQKTCKSKGYVNCIELRYCPLFINIFFRSLHSFLFLKLRNADEAKQAISQVDGYRMDKNHILSVFAFDDVEMYESMTEEYVKPEIEDLKPKEHLKSWLSDERARDQFAIVKGEEVGIYWNNKSELPDKVQVRTVSVLSLY